MSVMVVCASCGVPFASPHTGVRGGRRTASFCSLRCSAERQRIDRSAACEFCGHMFKPKYGGGHVLTRFCSRACRNARTPEQRAARQATERAKRIDKYWTELVCVGTNEYVRLVDLPGAWQDVARLIQESRLALGRRRVPEGASK